jgi:hypothetical protein
MSNHQSLIEPQHVPAGDGWDDAAAEATERTIKGAILKFADRRWTSGKEAASVKDGTKLVALATTAMWVRWDDGRPVEQLVRRPGERLPERENLSHTNEDEWRPGRATSRKIPGKTPASFTWLIPTPRKPSPSRPRPGADAAPSSNSATRSAACAPRTPTQRRSSNCALRRCRRDSVASQSRRSRSWAGKTPAPGPLKPPSRSSGSGRLSPPAVRRWLVLIRRHPRRRSKPTMARTTTFNFEK